MVRRLLKLTAGVGAAFAFGLPGGLVAQECAEGGNQHTRGADVELAYAARRDDPQPKETRYARALEKLGPALTADAPLPRADLLAGKESLGRSDFAGADSMLSKLTRVEPACTDFVEEIRFNAWVPLYNAGINHLQAGEQEEALQSFLTANVIHVDSRSLTNAANLYQQRGELETATQLYRQAIAAGGDAEMMRAASINLAELLRAQGRAEEALEIYSQYSASNPDDVLGILNYAIALMDAGEQETAEGMFESLMARDDLSFRQWSQVGIGQYRAQNFAKAATAFVRAHELSPLNKETLENLANTYYQSERYESLLPLADTLLQRYPYESMHYNLLASAHRELEDTDAALHVLQMRDSLEFEFLRAQLSPVAENAYSVDGQVMNKRAAPGTEIEVPLELLGDQGQILISEKLLLTLPAEGETAAFQLQVESEQPVVGFRYGHAGEASDS